MEEGFQALEVKDQVVLVEKGSLVQMEGDLPALEQED